MKWIAIVGSRRRKSKQDFKKVKKAFFDIYSPGDYIVSGGCPDGADNFAEKIAKRNGIPIFIIYANWKMGRHAGFVRNTTIAKYGDKLIACVAPDRTGGTEDTIDKFLTQKEKDDMIIV
jgi:hypothetical protein